MGRIPDETIHAIRDRVEIVDLVSRHVTLRQVGRSFKGLCPFHAEKTPSFHVNPERQIFHCFGCQAGGDVFGFLMRQENLTFPEAVRSLAQECGIPVPESGRRDSGLIERLCEANRVAERVYRKALAEPRGAGVRAYLEKRGVPEELVERFGLGFAPPSWDTVVRALGEARTPLEIGARAGLLAERSGGGHYDRLRGRLLFPIRDARGRTVGFGGRALEADQEPKYLNTPESPVFRKREAFYGLPEALHPIRKSGRVVIVEGYFDLLALHRAGVPETLATCGTALTPEHGRQLRRRTREVVLLFDGDEAGERAMERALAVLLPEGLRVRAAALPPGEDPDDLLAREGPEALRALVDAAPPALARVIQRRVARGCATPWEKADAVAALAPLLARVPDPVERGEFARRLALATDVRPADVDAAVRRQARPDAAVEEDVPVPAARAAGPEERFAARLVRLLIDHPDLAPRLEAEEMGELVPEGPWSRILPRLLAEARSGAVQLSRVTDDLEGPEASLLLALAVGEEPALEAEAAERALADTLSRLQSRRHSEARRALTRRVAEDPNFDAAKFLEAKQQQLEERRGAHAPRARPAPGSP